MVQMRLAYPSLKQQLKKNGKKGNYKHSSLHFRGTNIYSWTVKSPPSNLVSLEGTSNGAATQIDICVVVYTRPTDNIIIFESDHLRKLSYLLCVSFLCLGAREVTFGGIRN